MNDDQTAIERVLQGDAEAFRGLVQRHQGAVLRFALSFLTRHDDAEDVAQEVFLSAFRSLHTYNPARSAFATWLLTITRNRCLNRLKQRQHEVVAETAEPSSRRTPADDVGEQEFFHQLDVALQELPLDQRTAFVLAEIEEMPHAQIGILEDIPVGTVKSRVHRAKQRLQTLLQHVVEPTR